MWYKTKKELLESMGKDGRNRKFVDKMIERGVVIEENGLYIRRRDYEKLQIKGVNNDELEQLKKEVKGLKQKLEESNTNMEYYMDKYIELKEDFNTYDDRKKNGVWRKLRVVAHVGEDQYDDFCEWWEDL